jgi:Ala-tRNA(Pro) deacylase
LTGCEMGAVPPLSFHPDLRVYLDERLLAHHEIVFNAARLDRSMFVQLDRFIHVTRPTLASFALQ